MRQNWSSALNRVRRLFRRQPRQQNGRQQAKGARSVAHIWRQINPHHSVSGVSIVKKLAMLPHDMSCHPPICDAMDLVVYYEQVIMTAAAGMRGPKVIKLKGIVDSALESAEKQGHRVSAASEERRMKNYGNSMISVANDDGVLPLIHAQPSLHTHADAESLSAGGTLFGG
jgi:hypothetical protein